MTTRPRTVPEILDRAKEFAQRFEDYERSLGNECDPEGYAASGCHLAVRGREVDERGRGPGAQERYLGLGPGRLRTTQRRRPHRVIASLTNP